MHAERDHLVKQVFPRLAEWCESRKLRLVDIDLRWGVTEADATQNKRVVQVCLERIDACRPFFLCFLGQRRGWVPGEDDISADTYATYPELAAYAGEASVTELEILHALINPLHRGQERLPGGAAAHHERAEHAFFYLREPSYLADLPADPPQLRQVYTNEAIADAGQRAEADRQLQRWREVEIPRTGRPGRAYTARWSGEESTPEIRLPLQCPSTAAPGSPAWQASYENWARGWARAGVRVDASGEIGDPAERAKAEAFNARLTQGRLADFTCGDHPLAETIIADLQAAIQKRYPVHVEVTAASPLQRELDQQAQALRAASEGFIERAGDFAALDEYVNGPGDRLFVLTAPGGMGKTSLLARWIDHIVLNQAAGESLHYRFIGASDGSTTVDTLLRSVLREIRDLAGKFTEEIPADPAKLRADLPQLLQAAGSKGKVVIVLDGLNQLENKLGDLAWLPMALPANVRLIVSFKRGDAAAEACHAQLRTGGRAILAEVQPFASLEDRRKLVQVYLSQFLKELDERHVESLIRSEGAGNPLYLKVVLSELRIFGAFADLGAKIRTDFGTDPVSAFGGVLVRLENDPAYSPIAPELLVPRSFGWLAHARQGLSVEELSGLLIQEGGLPDDADGRQKAEEAVYGLLRQVRPYLARRDGRTDFFYESFKLAAIERYVNEGEGKSEAHRQARSAKAWHAALASYFGRQPLRTGANQEPNGHTLAELAFQYAHAGEAEALKRTLWDYPFIEARLEGADVETLIADYDLIEIPEVQIGETSGLRLLQDALRLSAHVLMEDRLQLPSQLTGRLLGSEDRDLRELLEQIRKEVRRPWLRPLHPCLDAPGRALLRTLTGYPGSFTGFLTVTQDGLRAVSESADHTLKVWDLENGRCIRTIQGLYGPLRALTEDGRRAVSASCPPNNDLKVWDLESGACLRTLSDSGFSYFPVAVSEDGKRAVSGSLDMLVSSETILKVWDLENGICLRTLAGPGVLNAVVISPEGRRAISASEVGNMGILNVWDLESGECLRRIEGRFGPRSNPVCAMTMSGHQAVAGSWHPDNTLNVWDLDSGSYLRSLVGHKSQVTAVAMMSDGRRAISGSRDRTLKVWDWEKGVCLQTLKGHQDAVNAVVVTQDRRRAVSKSHDDTLKVWNLNSSEGGEGQHGMMEHAEGITSVVQTPEGRCAVSGSVDGTLKVWDLKSGECLRTLAGHAEPIRAAVVTSDGQRVISGSRAYSRPWAGSLKVWNLTSGELSRTLPGQSQDVEAVAVTPDGQQLISGSNMTLIVWELASGACLHTLGGHTDCITAVAVTPDGRWAISGSGGASGSWDGTLKVWDIEKGVCLQTMMGHMKEIAAVAVTPDGRRVISWSGNSSGWGDYAFKMWDLASGACLHTFEGHTNLITAVAVTPDGQRVISGAGDCTLKVWELESGACIHTLLGHTTWIKAVLATPDGKRAISVSSDTLRVWDLESGRESISFDSDGHLYHIGIDSEGRTLTGSSDQRLCVLRLENSAVGSPFVTAWQPVTQSSIPESSPVTLAFGCPHCRTWPEVPASALDTELPCPHCGKPIKLNPFVIKADWRPVAAAWRGEP